MVGAVYRESQERVARPVLVVAFNGYVLGLDRTTGALLWQHTLYARETIELVVGDRFIVACTRTTLWCIDYPSGRMVGTANFPEALETRASIVFEGPSLFVAAGGHVYSYSTQGQLQWHCDLSSLGPTRMALGFPFNVRQEDTY